MQKARRRRRSSQATPSARWQRQHAGRRQAARQRRYLLRSMAEWLAASTAKRQAKKTPSDAGSALEDAMKIDGRGRMASPMKTEIAT